MPASKKVKTFDQAQDDRWVKETKDRLDKVAGRLDDGEDKSGPGEMEWMRAGTMDLEEWRLGEPIATKSTTTVRSGAGSCPKVRSRTEMRGFPPR